jgi:hypothetical protein
MVSHLWWLVGWPGAIVLLSVCVIFEIICIRIIGGDAGAFWFVTWHFILAPLLAGFAAILTIGAVTKAMSMRAKLTMIVSLVVPILIIMGAVTGDLGMLRFLSFR